MHYHFNTDKPLGEVMSHHVETLCKYTDDIDDFAFYTGGSDEPLDPKRTLKDLRMKDNIFLTCKRKVYSIAAVLRDASGEVVVPSVGHDLMEQFQLQILYNEPPQLNEAHKVKILDLARRVGVLANTLTSQNSLQDAEIFHRLCFSTLAYMLETGLVDDPVKREAPSSTSFALLWGRSMQSLSKILVGNGKLKISSDPAACDAFVVARKHSKWTKDYHGCQSTEYFASLMPMVAILSKNKRYAEAEAELLRVVDFRESKLGMDSPVTLSSISTLAGVYSNQKKYSLAVPLLEKCLMLQRRHLGYSAAPTIQTMRLFTSTLHSNGEYQKAAHNQSEVCNIFRAQNNFGSLIPALSTLASSLKRIPELAQETLAALRELVSVVRENSGNSHESLVSALKKYASELREAGDLVTAERYYVEVMEVCAGMLGTDHMDTSVARNNLATLYKSQKRYAESEELFKTCTEVKLTLNGSESEADVTVAKKGFVKHKLNVYNNYFMNSYMRLPEEVQDFETLARDSQEYFKIGIRVNEIVKGVADVFTAYVKNNISDGMMLNARANLAICLLRFVKADRKASEALLMASMEAMRSPPHNFDESHKWIVKIKEFLAKQDEWKRDVDKWQEAMMTAWRRITPTYELILGACPHNTQGLGYTLEHWN